MDIQKERVDNSADAAEELIANVSDIKLQNQAADTYESKIIIPDSGVEDEKKLFKKYKIKDIVFLAMMSAATMVTGGIMPLVGQIPLFGIIQLCLGLQFSLFPVIGMMKVRKPGSLILMSLFCGAIMVFMNTVMFVCILICAFIAESLALLIFRGYRNNGAFLLSGTLYFPLTLPFLYVWYKFIYTWTGQEGQAVSAFLGSSPAAAVGMSAAALAVSFIGAFLGMIISKELKKSGVMKK